MAPEVLHREECTYAFFSQYYGGIRRIQYIHNVNCPDCQASHHIVYEYFRQEGAENIYILYEKWDCRPITVQRNNRTEEAMIYSLAEVVSNLRRQLDDGIMVQYM